MTFSLKEVLNNCNLPTFTQEILKNIKIVKLGNHTQKVSLFEFSETNSKIKLFCSF